MQDKSYKLIKKKKGDTTSHVKKTTSEPWLNVPTRWKNDHNFVLNCGKNL